MYTIRNINKVYSSGKAEVVITIENTNPFSTSEVNETVIVPNGATMIDSDLLAAVIVQHKLDPTSISFAQLIVETPPVS